MVVRSLVPLLPLVVPLPPSPPPLPLPLPPSPPLALLLPPLCDPPTVSSEKSRKSFA